QPDRVDAELLQIAELRRDPRQVADAVAVGVGEAAHVDLVEDGVAPPLAHLSLRAIASPTCDVEASPPTSRVPGPSRHVSSSARIRRAEASTSPSVSSIRAALQIAPSGFAIPRPAMSGAEPCTGSKIGVASEPGARLALAAMPMPPWRT